MPEVEEVLDHLKKIQYRQGLVFGVGQIILFVLYGLFTVYPDNVRPGVEN